MSSTSLTADKKDSQSHHGETEQSSSPIKSSRNRELDPFDFFQWFHSRVSPGAFFSGALLAFIGCCVIGHSVRTVNIFRDFHRFYQGIEPVSSFYPTISELKNIVTSRILPGQTLVIIGGNSVLNGVGQPVARLWSTRLQEILGKNFCVVNLAFPGGEPFDASYLLAEALRDEHPNLIFVTTANPGQTGLPCGSLPYRHFYWQALYRGFLIDNASRAAEIKRITNENPDEEVRLGAYLNHLFCTSELWNAVSMRLFSTVWTPLSVSPKFGPLCARKHLTDDCQFLLPVKYRYLLHRDRYDSDMQTLRSISEPLFEKSTGDVWQPRKAFWSDFQQHVATVIPARMKKRVLVVLLPNSPYFVKQLTADEQNRQLLAFSESLTQWRGAGVHSTIAGANYTEEDYVDRLHLSPSGGSKLAEQMAAEIFHFDSKQTQDGGKPAR